jgi:VWFA-related protein
VRMRAALILGSLVSLGAAVGVAKAGANKHGATLRVETRLVEVNVVAQDSKGQPVKGLTRDDFKLYDDGREIPVDVFSAASPKTNAATISVPPNTFSNRLVGETPSATIILLDGLNTNFADQTWAQTEVVRFLKAMRPEDRVAILLLGERLEVLQGFTSDPKLLLQALSRKPARVGKDLSASGPPQPGPGSTQPVNLESALAQLASSLPTGQSTSASGSAGAASVGAAAAANAQAQQEQLMRQFEQHESAFFTVDRVDRTMDALVAIANYLAHFHGRKSLIWVSGGFPISIGFNQPRSPGDTRDQLHFSPEMGRALRALNNADLAVYPVDARGLVAGPAGPGLYGFYRTIGTMRELAERTGGVAFYNTNDVARVMRVAVEDSETNYTLGFYPRGVRWNGSYHTLKVKVTRPGIHVRYREGYYATLNRPKNGNQAKTLLTRALYSPLDSTGLGLTVTLDKEIASPTKRALLGIAIDAHNLTFQDQGGGKMVHLDIVVAQSASDGKVLKARRYDVNMRVAPNGLGLLLNRGLRLEKWVGLSSGAQTVELVVRDPASGRIGSVRVPLGS